MTQEIEVDYCDEMGSRSIAIHVKGFNPGQVMDDLGTAVARWEEMVFEEEEGEE